MIKAIYDIYTNYWEFFLCYWIIVSCIMFSRQLLAFIFYIAFQNKWICNYKPLETSKITIFVTIFDEDPEIVSEGLKSVRISFDKHCTICYIICIIDGADLFPEKASKMQLMIESYCDVILKTNAHSKRVNLRNMMNVAKEMNILQEFSGFLDSDTILADEDVARELLRPFQDSNIGGVTSAQRGLNPETVTERIGDWLENARLYSSMAAGSLFGQVGCLPGRLYVVRSCIVSDKMDELVEDYWRIPFHDKVQCVAGDDRVISNWVLKSGWKTIMMPSARVHTILPHTWTKLFKTWERWGRSSQGYTLRTLSWSWKVPWVLYQNLSDILITILTCYTILIHWPLSIFINNDSKFLIWYIAIPVGFAGMHLTMFLRQSYVIYKEPSKLFILPLFLFAITIGQFIRFKSLCTPHYIGIWGTRKGADENQNDPVYVDKVYLSNPKDMENSDEVLEICIM